MKPIINLLTTLFIGGLALFSCNLKNQSNPTNSSATADQAGTSIIADTSISINKPNEAQDSFIAVINSELNGKNGSFVSLNSNVLKGIYQQSESVVGYVTYTEQDQYFDEIFDKAPGYLVQVVESNADLKVRYVRPIKSFLKDSVKINVKSPKYGRAVERQLDYTSSNEISFFLGSVAIDAGRAYQLVIKDDLFATIPNGEKDIDKAKLAKYFADNKISDQDRSQYFILKSVYLQSIMHNNLSKLNVRGRLDIPLPATSLSIGSTTYRSDMNNDLNYKTKLIVDPVSAYLE